MTTSASNNDCGTFDMEIIFEDDETTIVPFNATSSSASDPKSSTPKFISPTKLRLADIIRVDFNEIPDYLSKRNPYFEQKIRTLLPNTEHLEELRAIAILMYRIRSVEMIHSLWLVYLKSGLGKFSLLSQANGINMKIWPKQILDIINKWTADDADVNDDKDRICLDFTNECLRQCDAKSNEYRNELQSSTCSLSYYTPSIEHLIQKFVEQGIECFRIEIDCHIALVECHYREEIWKQELLRHHFTDEQKALIENMVHLKYRYEGTKWEWTLLNEKHSIQLSKHPYGSQELIRSPLINTLQDPNLRQQLFVQYKTILRYNNNDELNTYMNEMKEQMSTYLAKFNQTIGQFWKINKSMSTKQPLPQTTVYSIEHYLENIEARFHCIYKFKTALFHI